MMRFSNVNSPRNDLQRLTKVIGVVGSAFGVIVIAIMVYAGVTSDRAAIQRDQGLVENALDQSVTRVLNEQKSVSWWDDTVKNVVVKFDKKWIDEQIGVFLTETYGHDEMYILSDKDQVIYAAKGGESTDQAPPGRLKDIAPVVNVIRTGKEDPKDRDEAFADSQVGYDVLSKVLEFAKWDGQILSVDGKPAVVTAITIAPNTDISLAKGKPYLLVSVEFINDAFVHKLGRSLLLNDLALGPSSAVPSGAFSEPFVTDDGQSFGAISWTPKRPGRILLTVVLPLVALGLFGSGYVTALALRRLRRASSELTRREADAVYQSRHDALSGLPNRVMFTEVLEQALAAQLGGSGPKAIVAYLDVDRFKDINDTLGHHAGDELIKIVANRLRRTAQAGDFLARFGGDEFALLRLSNDEEAAPRLAELLMGAFHKPFEFLSQNMRVTASVGLAHAPEHGSTTAELMRNADIALYKAKSQGRDQAVAFSAEMEREVQLRRAVEMDLRNAIGSDQLTLYYQPIISCQTNAIVGVEALIRWFHPEKGNIPPSSFIPIAEEAGLMPTLGAWVIERAFADCARWPEIETAINLSPDQFRHLDLAQFLRGAARKHAVDTSRIVLEITESLLLESSPRVKATLHDIRELGFKVALDDFGTGHSSLTYLRVFRFDKLKIDRSFVTGLPQAENTRTIVHSVVNLGRALGMEVVAEGVENEPEAAMMRLFGCTSMQGYHFSKPIEREACQRLIEAQRTRAKVASDTRGSVVDLELRRG